MPQDRIAEAGRKVLRWQFDKMLNHEPGTRSGEDIEELHDMRVATRRMRTAFDLFEDAFDPRIIQPHIKGLRKTAKSLGRVRDLDVFMEKTRRFLDTLPETERFGLEPVRGACSQKWGIAREMMLAYLESEEYRGFKQDFSDFLDAPGSGIPADGGAGLQISQVREVAPKMIAACLENARSFQAALANPSVETLHALRIALKRLRYTIEFFLEVLGPDAENCILLLKGLQDHLGNLNDAETGIKILEEILEQWNEEPPLVVLGGEQRIKALSIYMAAKREELSGLVESFPQEWKNFADTAFERSLKSAISIGLDASALFETARY